MNGHKQEGGTLAGGLLPMHRNSQRAVTCKGLTHHLLTFFFFIFESHLQHMEVPRPGVESELQLPAYTTAMATPDPSHMGKLRHSW